MTLGHVVHGIERGVRRGAGIVSPSVKKTYHWHTSYADRRAAKSSDPVNVAHLSTWQTRVINSGRDSPSVHAGRSGSRTALQRDAPRGMESPNCPEAASPDEASGANSAVPLCTQLAEHLGGSHGCTYRAMLTRTTRRLVLYVPEAQGAQGPTHCTYAVRLLAWGVPY